MKTMLHAMIASSLVLASGPVLARAMPLPMLQKKDRCSVVLASMKTADNSRQCPAEVMA